MMYSLKQFSLSMLVVAVVSTTASTSAAAQDAVVDNSPFRQLDLPSPNAFRTASGRPGAAYWQQRADYDIKVTLDPSANSITGTETIRYTNNSPDELPYLWMHLEQNMCASGSTTKMLDQPPLVFLGSVFDFSCKDFVGGITVSRVASGSKMLSTRITGPTMRVDLPQPLRPGASITLELSWSFPIPPYGGARMGRDEELYEIAQFYPRMAVYDDVRGWNNDPYIGAGEFYLEYGTFEYEVTLPRDYIVVGTGALQNPEEVLTFPQRERLEKAAASDDVVAIISESEAGNSDRVRPRGSGNLTWRFRAENVRDVAFAASPNFRWDATSWDGILIQTLYRGEARKWEEAIKMAKHSIRFFSEQWFRYPYPHATTIEGPIEGMEYPMITFVPDSPSREDLQWVLSHEFGHEWFPMIVGSNERLYPWMDEGFNTFIDLAGAADYFSGTEYGNTIEWNPLRLYPEHAIPGQERPMINRPVEQTDLFWGAYQKPALMMQLLRYEVLGKERFDDAFREYIRAWAYKHPTPADFFRLMRDASGMDLDWYWRDWVFTTSRLDQAVSGVEDKDGQTRIILENLGSMEMPAEVKIDYSDGTSTTVKLPVEMWNLGPVFKYPNPQDKRIVGIEIDPRDALPDTDRSNNSWKRR